MTSSMARAWAAVRGGPATPPARRGIEARARPGITAVALLAAWVLAAGCAHGRDDPPPPPGADGPGKGVAVCVGLNAVDPNHYAGWEGKLFGCENDAADMVNIATQNRFGAKKLLTAHATRDAVLAEIRAAAAQLKSGDIFMISYSGHGDQIPDPNAPTEDDHMDQTWCLYDGELLDKELYAEWAKFAAGVRILVISDSCHSQGIARMVPRDYAVDLRLRDAPNVATAESAAAESVRRLNDAAGRFAAAAARAPGVRIKAVPPEKSVEVHQKEKPRYDKIIRDVPRPAEIPVLVLSLTACKNQQLAGDGNGNGVFTGALKQVWNGGHFQGDYLAFHQQVAAAAAEVRDSQDAQWRMIPRRDQPFLKQRPFTVAAP